MAPSQFPSRPQTATNADTPARPDQATPVDSIGVVPPPPEPSEIPTAAGRPAVGRDEPPPEPPGYRVLREIGRGGVGVVYEAEQLALKRRVALKVLRPNRLADPELFARFHAEAEALARLPHANVV